MGPVDDPLTGSSKIVAQGVADHQQNPPKHFGLPEGLHGDQVREIAQGASYTPVDDPLPTETPWTIIFWEPVKGSSTGPTIKLPECLRGGLVRGHAQGGV